MEKVRFTKGQIWGYVGAAHRRVHPAACLAIAQADARPVIFVSYR